MPVYMLKLRHTGSPNIGGGEGAMIGEDVSYTLATGQDQTMFQPENGNYIVRRLTPRECERLQGFPDDWTKVPYDKVMTINAKPDDKGAFILYYDEDTGEPVWKKHKKIHVPIEECPDGPRYKALGNSMAVPVMRWLGERIQMVDEIIKEIND